MVRGGVRRSGRAQKRVSAYAQRPKVTVPGGRVWPRDGTTRARVEVHTYGFKVMSSDSAPLLRTNGPCSWKKPPRLEQPGPPFSQKTIGAVSGLVVRSTYQWKRFFAPPSTGRYPLNCLKHSAGPEAVSQAQHRAESTNQHATITTLKKGALFNVWTKRRRAERTARCPGNRPKCMN